jgi:outer membrane protein assembly factor BamB
MSFSRVKSMEGDSKPEGEHSKGSHQASLEVEENRWDVTMDGRTWSFPSDRTVVAYDVSVEIADETAYVAIFGSTPISYSLYAVARDSGKVVWKSHVCAADHLTPAYSGHFWHTVQICVHGKELTVWGVSDSTAYVETFDTKTGKNLWRFATACLEFTGE